MKAKTMTKKQSAPAPEDIRKAYKEEYLKWRTDAEEFADFTETKLAEFISTYEDAHFAGIFTCLDHNFYDQVRNKIATNSDMRAADNASGNAYSVHLKTWSGFLESKAYRNLLKRRINIEGASSVRSSSGNKTVTQPSPSPVFREETEGERKHITKETDVIQRNPRLRQMCLDMYGYQCQCCGMDFASLYGEELGANFIEVHHLKMISSFETDGVPENFVENLVPLCSNCHSMIHHVKDSEHPLRDLREAYRGIKKMLKIRKEE